MVFRYLKQRKREKRAADRIGVQLHRQISVAFAENEKETSKRLMTPFTTGYIYGLVHLGFSHQGIEGEPATDTRLKYICDGVLPKKLYSIFQSVLSTVEYAKSLGEKNEVKGFELGVEVGASDAGYFSVCLSDDEDMNEVFASMAGADEPNSLSLFLVGREESIKYQPLE